MQVPFEYMQSLFIAPTGWGKTTMLMELIKSSDKVLIYYSPLRALADEFSLRLKQSNINVFYPRSKSELAQVFDHIQAKVIVLTYEKVSDLVYGKLIDGNFLHVFDEIHLNFYWGESFRVHLKDFINEFLHLDLNVLLLTATLEDRYQEELERKATRLSIIQIANFQLKSAPKKIYTSYSKKHLKNNLSSLHKRRTLVFCRYRKEVKTLAKHYRQKGYVVLSCISGEVEQFQKELLIKPDVDYIFCTSTLSHGVNLPTLDTVVILYSVDDRALWTQMVGRAGRNGEEFTLYHMNNYTYGKSRTILQMFNWFLKYSEIKIKNAFRGYFSS